MPTLRFIRDSLAIDDTLLARLAGSGIAARAGDTLVLAAARCTLTSLSQDFDYIILADELVAGQAPIGVAAAGDPAPAVIVRARSIAGALSITVTGVAGVDGDAGPDGDDGVQLRPDKPVLGPGGDGENGQPGGQGGHGGAITIRYGAAASTPVASGPGGEGGLGGPGGHGGKGRPPGKSGKQGAKGARGPSGAVSVTQVAREDVFQTVDGEVLAAWSRYRTDVGEYHYRVFDPESQLRALAEFDAALELDPANARAATLRQRLILQQTPGGVSRELDISPAFRDISEGLLGETQLVLSEFLAVQETATQAEIADATNDQLGLVLRQLADRMAEAQLDVVSAQSGIEVADAESTVLSTQIRQLQEQIDAARDKRLSLFESIATVGEIGAAIGGLATGVGAIVSIPGALAAAEHPESGLRKVLGFLADGKSFWDDKDVGGHLSDLLAGGKDAVTNFSKVYGELSRSDGEPAIKQLAMQKATLTMQLMVADLRRQQARDQLHAARVRVDDYTAEVQIAQILVDKWHGTEEEIEQGLQALLDVARALADLVAEHVFLARRALEIYQLEEASSVRFDYGRLHPDQDHDLTSRPLRRVQLCLQSVTRLPVDVITWNGIFVALNAAQTASFDVVHPSIEVVVDDPAALAELRAGRGLKLSVGIGPSPVGASFPDGIFELKVDNLTLDLLGASASAAALMWVRHSGHWIMARRPTAALPDPPDVEFTLLPHVEAFNFRAGSGTLTAAIPAGRQANVEPGPPFSFWGRGALADWTVFVDRSATALNLTGLSAIRLTIGCIGLVSQGTVVPPLLRLRPEALVVAEAGQVAPTA